MINLRELFEFDPAKKKGEQGYARAQRIVTHLRQSMGYIVSQERAKINKTYLYGLQDMNEIKSMFRDPKKAGIKFWQLATMEKIRNVLIAEEENQGIHFELKAVDATAVNQRMRDQLLLENRGWIDATMTGVNSMMGLPPFNMLKEKGLFAGNVGDFDKMGLDSSNLQDLNYFFAQHYRLLYEMVGEEPVNFFIEYNELDEMLPLLMNDIIAVKALGMRANVNDITGAIDYKYLAPENIKAIRGKRRDFKDASAIGYEQSMSVQDVIKLIGNEFDYDRDIEELLRAVSTSAQRNYTGIISGNQIYWGTKENPIDYGEFLNYQVMMGYVEWKEIDASAHKVSKSNKRGQFGLRPISIFSEVTANSVYEKDVRYYETTYKAYYLSFGMYAQRLYKYGKLSYQMTEGVEDEYSNFSIIAMQEFGKSAVEVAMPWIEMIEKAVKKMEFMINKAKPPGRLFNYESIFDIAKTLYPKVKPELGVDMVLKLFTESSNELYTLPKVNGQPVGGGAQVNFDIPHGISDAVMKFKEIYDWANGNILNDLGISPYRSVYQPGERDSPGVQNQVNDYSIKATQYMHKMVVNVVKNLGKRTLCFVQDIIQFKDVNTVPYKFLVNAVGDATMEQLKNIGNTSLHRFGVFVHGINMAADKQQQKAIALQALQKGDIGYEQWLLINSIASPKKAMMVLAYEKLRTERVQAQNQARQSQSLVDLENTKHNNKLRELNLEGILGIKRENMRGYWYAEGQKIRADADVAKLKMTLNAQPQQQEQQMENQINTEAAGGGAAPPPGGAPVPGAPGAAGGAPPDENEEQHPYDNENQEPAAA